MIQPQTLIPMLLYFPIQTLTASCCNDLTEIHWQPLILTTVYSVPQTELYCSIQILTAAYYVSLTAQHCPTQILTIRYYILLTGSYCLKQILTATCCLSLTRPAFPTRISQVSLFLRLSVPHHSQVSPERFST